MKKILYLAFTLLTLITAPSAAQQKTTIISGTVSDSTLKGLYLVNISIIDATTGTFTDNKGHYSLRIPMDKREHVLLFSSIGYDTLHLKFVADKSSLVINVVLKEKITSLNEILIRNRGIREAPTISILPVKDINLAPSSGNNIESMIIALPGVISRDELSSRYSVRGGSFDENLVYINDIEIYRPRLIKSGMKEGLSILNSDMVATVYFSPGGFNSSYGDKMSSVLDIRYREPEEFAASVNPGLLNSSAHIEGLAGKGRVSYITGIRYMSNRYLLRTLDTVGSYTPYFVDIQSVVTIRTGRESSLSLLITGGSNIYGFNPVSRRSSFGSVSQAYRLYVDYEGFEKDHYKTFNGALKWKWSGYKGAESHLIFHTFRTSEQESYDIRGSYSLNQLEITTGMEEPTESLLNIGTGVWLDHARNNFEADIYTLAYNTRWQHSSNVLSWGTRYKKEYIADALSEWRLVDSAGYSLPLSSTSLELDKSVNATNKLASERIEAYILDNYLFSEGNTDFIFTAGARISYWSFNDEILFSPRVSLEADPAGNLNFYLAAGRYYQTPFYREMRYPDGSLNRDIRSQSSLHFVAGSNLDITGRNTTLRLSAELYHKVMNNLIPYKFDNVRVIYAAENTATGNATGLDLRLHGEFVSDANSWISLSLMKVNHDIITDISGPYPAPTDIRFATDIFFRDYLKSNPTFKAHIRMHFSTGMPVSSPYSDSYQSYSRMPPYRRVDIGFTKTLKSNNNTRGYAQGKAVLQSLIIGFDIFNLLDIDNTISYHWLSAVNNLSGEERQFAVPNYLTGRSLNLRISAQF